ncbi:MAG: response regulator [Terracidiphilus sp.]
MTQNDRRLRVLIADDERSIADTLALILSHKGFDAHAVYSGERAVEAAAHLAPDVLISDVLMGGMTGIDAAIRIRELFPRCRVILFSGMEATTELIHQARTGVVDFDILSKPVHPRILLEHLNRPE